MTAKQKPCPFCGSPDIHTTSGRLSGFRQYHCNNCDARGPVVDAVFDGDKAWNERAESSDLEAYKRVCGLMAEALRLTPSYLADACRVAKSEGAIEVATIPEGDLAIIKEALSEFAKLTGAV